MAGHAVTCLAQAQETLIPNGASWRWRKGTNEVSNPTTAWRQPGFNDSAWLTGAMPFYYGPGGITGGTVLSDMRYNYTTVYLRRTFVVADPAAFASLTLREVIDDGFIVWINGVEVQRYNVYAGEQPYDAGTPVAIGSSPVEVSANLGNPGGLLVPGANTIAVHLFNRNLTSSDLHLNLELTATLLNTNPPAITSVSPPHGATVTALSQVEVIFNRPVSGVDAQDLLVNDQPASAVIGNPGTNRYTFTFTQPQPGIVDLRWDESPGIVDLEGGAFDPTATNAFWSYTLVDTAAPQVSARSPVSGATVSQLTRVEVWFNEPVFGVDAADLRINGQPATDVTGAETGPYVFLFPQPTPGTVNFSWVDGHGITDLVSNAFGGGDWSVTLNPAHAPGDRHHQRICGG
jgi:prepilin-type processing-associated H-X9-DG protein